MREVAIAEARIMASNGVLDGHLILSHAIDVSDAANKQVLVVRFGNAIAIAA